MDELSGKKNTSADVPAKSLFICKRAWQFSCSPQRLYRPFPQCDGRSGKLRFCPPPPLRKVMNTVRESMDSRRWSAWEAGTTQADTVELSPEMEDQNTECCLRRNAEMITSFGHPPLRVWSILLTCRTNQLTNQ